MPRCVLLLLTATASCALITFDCNAPSERMALASGIVSDPSNTIQVEAFTSVGEERGPGRNYSHALTVGIQSPNAAQGVRVPSVLRGHVLATRLELASGEVVYRVALPNNPGAQDERLVIGVISNTDLPQSDFASIRAHLLANELFAVVETD